MNTNECERLSIDILPEEHKQIKSIAALHGQTIKEFVLESIRERIRREKERSELSVLSMHPGKDAILKELWDNEKDSEYDKL